MQRGLFDQDEPPSHQRLSDEQIDDARQRHPGMILMFRTNDRYELFDQDALLVSEILGIQRMAANGRQVTSFPYQSLEGHLRTLLRHGHRIAICESENQA